MDHLNPKNAWNLIQDFIIIFPLPSVHTQAHTGHMNRMGALQVLVVQHFVSV